MSLDIYMGITRCPGMSPRLSCATCTTFPKHCKDLNPRADGFEYERTRMSFYKKKFAVVKTNPQMFLEPRPLAALGLVWSLLLI